MTEVALDARAPFDGEGVLRWLTARAVPGIEEVSGGVYRRGLRLAGGPGVVGLAPDGDRLRVTLRLTDPADRSDALAQCRALFDLDADTEAHAAVLGADPALARAVAARPGLRAPATVDPAETAVRAVLGQQVSLAAARTLAGRLVALCGAPLAAPDGTLTDAFPSAAAIAGAPLERIGLPAARQRTLRELCARLAAGDLDLGVGADPAATRMALLAIPGVGPWTADYVALRALGDRDAFPAGDLGLRRGARALGLPSDPRGLEAHSKRWRPWRRYAAHYLWSA